MRSAAPHIDALAGHVATSFFTQRDHKIRGMSLRICPLAATKTPWPSQNVTGFASRRTATLPDRRIFAADALTPQRGTGTQTLQS